MQGRTVGKLKLQLSKDSALHTEQLSIGVAILHEEAQLRHLKRGRGLENTRESPGTKTTLLNPLL